MYGRAEAKGVWWQDGRGGQGCERQSSACPPPHAGGVGVCCSWAILSPSSTGPTPPWPPCSGPLGEGRAVSQGLVQDRWHVTHTEQADRQTGGQMTEEQSPFPPAPAGRSKPLGL